MKEANHIDSILQMKTEPNRGKGTCLKPHQEQGEPAPARQGDSESSSSATAHTTFQEQRNSQRTCSIIVKQ